MNTVTYSRPSQCDGKRGYPTYLTAKQANGRRLDIYHCPHCGQFHLGNKPKGQGRPKPPPPAIELEF